MTTVQHDASADLLARYDPATPFFFASPRGTLATEGEFFTVPDSGDVPASIRGVLDLARTDGQADPIVCGALPFDRSGPPRLTVPVRTHRAGPLPTRLAPPAGPAAGPVRRAEVPSGAAYADGVRRAVARMRAGELDKVVLARALDVTTDAPIDIGLLLRRLAARDPTGYTFAAGLGEGAGTLVGSSPELLLSRHGALVTTNPLAGSIARSADPAEDSARAHALLGSPKDRREHALVIDAVAEALRPYCDDLDVPAGPCLIRTAAMWHLSTVITGRVKDPSISSLTLAAALHPTPAVCGTPTPDARAAIAEYEPFDRGFYTGLVGWEDARGDGEWVLVLRCAVAEGRTARLYAGAGVVADSDPHAELAETTAKFRTMLTGLGL
ncbi:isochorismate synthase [Spirilliplanes yamanashiensis]|uniref:isochorismate synthase n=1 Tax=Spirilliplanes yamanashiensis TaxID=42233 RepID=A0A8J3YEC8_9ACTN|nr:isochorismate synthase [Spirilliplanes yamanashiensis]MDP9815203.1 isochorismate synthase [Spirilliplanes yamanashiensis]GIJ06529.1 isochorismate synthase EntC [Spirilliplanes yamanashiensis]